VGWRTRIAAVLTIPLRRSIWHTWLQPIARIGAIGDDEYPLQPEHRVGRDSLRTKLTAIIRARSDGELFLFVNDLVIGLPYLADMFYRDNLGTATVTVELFRQPGRRPAPRIATRCDKLAANHLAFIQLASIRAYTADSAAGVAPACPSSVFRCSGLGDPSFSLVAVRFP
jgi:hypothetical protein